VNAVYCPYCHRAAAYSKTSSHLYRDGKDYGDVWFCQHGCEAWCGCHPDGRPLGTLGNKQLRNARAAAHQAFDPLWQNWQLAYPDATECTQAIKGSMRTRAYRWLATHMRMEFDACHIGGMTLEQTVAAMKLIDALRPTSASIRAWWKAQSSNGAARARAALRGAHG
jgi:hypothetical protein